MSTQEYFHVFESIIYAAIVTQILVGWGKMIVDRGAYKPYWAHLLFTIDLFLLMISNYYAGRELSHFDAINGTFSFIFLVVATPSLYFMVVYFMFPSQNKDVDFKDLIHDRMREIFLPLLIYLALGAMEDIWLSDASIVSHWPDYLSVVLVLVIIITRSTRMFEIMSVVILLLFVLLGG